MKITIALAVIIGSSALGAPTDDLLKTMKSAPYGGAPSYGGGHSYGGGQSYGGGHSYGGVPSYGSASYGPPCSGAPLAPIALYLAPQSGGHYREEDSTGEHSGQARSYEASGYGASSSIAQASGGAVGYFPHANIGGCGVPLLLSCAPNVVAGHLAKAHAYPSIPSYKQNENHEETTELREAKEKSWTDAEKASQVGHHHHLIALNENHEVKADHTHNAPV